MTEEMDALQQAMADAQAGVLQPDVTRFPEKSHHWLRAYEAELARYRCAATRDRRAAGEDPEAWVWE